MSEKPAFVVPVHDLDSSGRAFAWPVPVSWLARTLADTEGEVRPREVDGSLSVRVSKVGDDVIVSGEAKASLAVSCARCLVDVPLDVVAPLALLLVPRAGQPAGAAVLRRTKGRSVPKAVDDAAKPAEKGGRRRGRAEPDEEIEISAEDADLDTYEGEEVVLDPFVREALLLETPTFPLCSDACEGITPPPEARPRPDAEAPGVDPRLAPLLKFSPSKQKRTPNKE